MDKPEAQKLFPGLREAMAAHPGISNEDDYGIEAKTWDGERYHVYVKVPQKSFVIDPDEARDMADALLAAADEVESLSR
jgi:hypothetical protein